MAGNTNTLSKKTIVAIVIAIVLLFVASLSVGIFLANRGDAEAAGGNQISDVNQTENNNQNTSSDNNQAPDQNTNIENNNTDSNNTENNNTENNNPETPNTDGNAGTVVDNNKTTNNNTNNNGTVNNAENNTENRTNNNTAGVTTDANVNQVGETTVTRVEERERLVSRDYWDWWTPTSVAVASTATRLSPTTPDITVEKVATTGVGKNKFVYANKNITYTIKVTNNGEQELKNIEITDKIPEQTTFVSIDDAQNSGTTILENDTVIGLKWIVTVPAKESIEVKFTVKVNENATGTISNVAISNGTPSDTVETAIIESEKTATVEGKTEKTAVKGDTIHYAITVRNTGNVSGETLVKDADLKEILSNVAEMKGKVIVQDANGTREVTAEELIQGVKVQVNANSEATVTFDVTITSVNGAIKNVALIGESEIPTDPEIVDTEGVQVTKNVTSTDKDNDGKYDLNEIIEYEVEVKNIGSITLNNVVVNDDNSEEKTATIDTLAPGETKSVNFTHVVTEADIKAGKVINRATVKDTPSNEVTTDTEEPREAVELTKTVIGEDENKDGKYALGEIIHYEVSVKNIGNVTLSNVVVNDGNSDEKTKTIDTLVPGETKSVEFTHKVVEDDIKAGKVVNKATVKDTPSNTVETPTENPKEAVELTKTVTGEDENKDGKYALGETIHYEVSVKNIGNVTLKNVEVKDGNSKEKTATIPTIEPGDTKSVNFTHVVTEDDIKAGEVINKATAKDTPSNEVTTPTELANPSIDVQKTIVKVKDTEIPENTEVAIKAQKEDKIMYQIVATNNGNTTLSNVKITDDKKVTLESATLPERLADMTITIGNNINANTNLLGRNDITLQPGETITLTVSYTLQKADVLGSKDFVNTATATGKYDKTEPKDDDSATIETEFTPEMGEKSVEKVWDDENYASNRPNDITVQLMNGKTPVGDPVKLSETNEWKHTWKELPLEDGNGKAITYTVKEDKVENYTTTYSKEQNGKFVITNSYNKPKAGGTITIHSTKSQEVKAPLDVVFILDTSGSMDDNSRATKAVTAINKAIAQVQGYNQYNRVGVVGFSGTYGEYDMWGNYYLTSKDKTDSTELLKLDRYTAKTTSNDVKQYLTINDKKINTNVKELATQNGRYVDGGTYTQIGIAEASKMLQKADKKVTIDGVEVTRTPVIILISDGEPTYYTENYTAVTSQNRGGTGSNTTADHGYYTILSANYYKQQVTTHYGRTAMMYTIGMGIKKQEDDRKDDNLFARTVLNPDTNNKDKCSQKRRGTKEKQLYNEIQNISNYADGAYFGEMKESELTKILTQVIQSSIPKERTEKITAEQIENAKVELKDIDTSKEFSLKAGKTTYNTFEDAKTAGVIAGDETNGYYVDLTKVPAGSDLEISYHEK